MRFGVRHGLARATRESVRAEKGERARGKARRTRKVRTILPAVHLLAASVAAQLTAVATDTAPVIDGRLDDAAWQGAPESTAFTQKFPREGATPTERTSVRVVYDRDAVYVGIDCEQRSAPVVRRLTRRDRVVEADWVSIAIDARSDGVRAVELTVNSAGVLADGLHYNDTEFSSSWDENWEARTHVRSGGWSAEYRIPLRILRFRDRPVQTWGFQVRRYVSSRQETDEWSFIPRGAAGEVSRYGKLDNLTGLKTQNPIELRPFLVGRVRKRDPVPGYLAHGIDVTGSLGLDVKWHPSQDLTLDVTLNPDFGQVEADQVVLNLSNFETFYPERRPFFADGVDTFASPFNLVYTRRIGHVAAPPALRAAPGATEKLVDATGPATIYGASKLVGRLDDHWEVGTLAALAGANKAEVARLDGTRDTRVAEPLTAYNALRLKRLVRGGYVGVLGTAVTRSERTDAYVAPFDAGSDVAASTAGGAPTEARAQALCPQGVALSRGRRCFHDAYAGAIDFNWRSTNGEYAVNGGAVGSLVHEGPERTLRDGTTLRAGDVGTGARLYAGKEGGRHWVYDVLAERTDRKLEVNDFGYQERQNQQQLRLALGYRTLEPWFVTAETRTRLEARAIQNLEGLDLGRSVGVFSSLRFKNNWRGSTNVYRYLARFDDREVGDGTALERAGVFGTDVSVASDARGAFTSSAYVSLHHLPETRAFFSELTLGLRAFPQLDLDVIPQVSASSGEPRYVGRGADGSQLLFGRLEAKSVGVTVRATYSFSPTLTLQSYAQAFFASGHYGELLAWGGAQGRGARVRLDDLAPLGTAPPMNPDFANAALNVNVLLRWEWRLGSTFFLAYARSQAPNVQLGPREPASLPFRALPGAPATDVLLLKLSHWWG